MTERPTIHRYPYDRWLKRVFFNHGTWRNWHLGINTRWTGKLALLWFGPALPDWMRHSRDMELAIDVYGTSVDLFVTYTFSHGTPDTYNAAIGGPGGWEPGDPAEVSILDVEVATGPKDARQYVKAQQWLIDIVANSDSIYQQICRRHEDDHYDYEPDFDRA